MECEFRTPVEVVAPLRQIQVADVSLFLGSCFAQHVGGCFRQSRLQALVNPAGVLFNPVSIAHVVGMALGHQPLSASHFFQSDGMWHCWLTDSGLSALTLEQCRAQVERALQQIHDQIARAHHLFITLGTNHCYALTSCDMVVGNCHRQPGAMFCEQELGVEQVEQYLCQMVQQVTALNPRVQIAFTVSPFRYRKYGFHRSQVGKSTLMVAIDRVIQAHADVCCYFPAFELVMDELRDYRFYDADMLHPGAQAVQYIWRYFQQHWMTPDVHQYLQRWQPLADALAHRPLHPESAAYRQFQQRTAERIHQLQADYPQLPIESILNSEQ